MDEIKRNKAVIFDLDGTLIDSVPDIAENINIMLKEFGYKTLSEEEVKSHVGHGARNLVKDCIGLPLTDNELDERLAFYNEKYTASGSPHTRLFDGVKDMLARNSSVTEAALENGFPNVKSFITMCKKVYGLTPAQYKKHYENN